MKKLTAVLLALVLVLSVAVMPASAKTKSDAVLRFNSDGKFRILNFADSQDTAIMDPACKMFLKDSVAVTKPDLVVISGDCISGGSSPLTLLGKMAISNFMKIFEEAGVKVAIVYGNHDSEGAMSKEDMMAYYETYDCFVGCEGEDLTGCGNYNLPILAKEGSQVKFNLWLFDSLTYNGGDHKDAYPEDPDNKLGGYGCVHKDQIEWYKRTSTALAAANDGKPVPSIAFQHIIVPEIWEALKVNDTAVAGSVEHGGKYYSLPENATGKIGESPCPPPYTNGQLDAFVKQGDVLALFTGHDHTNTMEVDCKGVKLISTPGCGFNSYGNADRGARVIDIKDDGTFTSSVLKWRDFYGADKNEMANARFVLSGNEFETGEKINAFFTYFLGLLSGKKIEPVIKTF